LPPKDGVFHLFAIRTYQRNLMKEMLNEFGIGAKIHYPFPTHLHEHVRNNCCIVGDMKETLRWAHGELSLPIYPKLQAEQVDYICSLIRRWV